MPPGPVTPKERRKILDLIEQGKSRNEIVRLTGRAAGTVSKIAAEAGRSFARGPEVIAATEARRIDLAARRTDLAHALHQDAERLRAQLWEPCRYGEFAGKDGKWQEVQLDRPRFGDQRAIIAAAGTAVTQSLRLAPVEGGEGAEQVRSMLGAIGEALTRAADDEQPDGGDE